MSIPLMILENEPLAKHTIFQIGGPARYFFRVKSYDDMKNIMAWLTDHPMPFTVLGGGSNVLASDAGFDGLVIKMEDRSLDIQGSVITASAGVIFAVAAKTATDAGLMGLEWAYGIPGTIGGAVRGNAGAFGSSISEHLSLVEVFDTTTQEIVRKTPQELAFSYRRSAFALHPHWIVTHAILRLTPDDPSACKARLQEYLARKKEGQPLGVQCAGCTFKNIPIASIRSDVELPVEYLHTGQVPAGYLLEKCNLKNHVVGRAMISSRHANFIINLGGATCQDVVGLIGLAKKTVFDTFGAHLEEEIQYIGDVGASS